MSFMGDFVMPLFQALACIAPGASAKALAALHMNRQAWQDIGNSDDPDALVGGKDVPELPVYGGKAIEPFHRRCARPPVTMSATFE